MNTLERIAMTGPAQDRRITKRLKVHKALRDQYMSEDGLAVKTASSKAFYAVQDMTETQLDMWIKVLCPAM